LHPLHPSLACLPAGADAKAWVKTHAKHISNDLMLAFFAPSMYMQLGIDFGIFNVDAKTKAQQSLKSHLVTLAHSKELRAKAKTIWALAMSKYMKSAKWQATSAKAKAEIAALNPDPPGGK
jgi:hypothetical protein